MARRTGHFNTMGLDGMNTARKKAWETRRAKHGPKGHGGYSVRYPDHWAVITAARDFLEYLRKIARPGLAVIGSDEEVIARGIQERLNAIETALETIGQEPRK